jgi:cytochrome c-type biogenesis protein CcmH/NrfG
VVVVPGPRVEPAPLVPGFDPSQAIEAAAQAGDEGRFLEALAILHEAIPRLTGRDRRAARVCKARVLLAVDNGAKLAEEELRAAIAEDSGNAEARIALGGIYQERGSVALAAVEYRKALELQPRNAAAREALDRLQALPGDNPPQGSALKKPLSR